MMISFRFCFIFVSLSSFSPLSYFYICLSELVDKGRTFDPFTYTFPVGTLDIFLPLTYSQANMSSMKFDGVLISII